MLAMLLFDIQMEAPRATVKLKKKNPLFQKWLTELHEKAVQTGNPDQQKLKTALTSLEKYPLVLKNGEECAILKGFGKTLCAYLDKKLEEHRNKRSKSQYVPAYRTGGYAILCTLYENKLAGVSEMTKKELEYQGQKYCDSSFTKRKPGAVLGYTAWASMKTLIAKGLVNKCNNKFCLTSLGVDMSEHLSDFNNESQSSEHLLRISPVNTEETIPQLASSKNIQRKSPVKHKKPISKSPSSKHLLKKIPINTEEKIPKLPSFESKNPTNIEDLILKSPPLLTSHGNESALIFNIGDFEVFLLIDKQETNFTSKEDDVTISEMKKYPSVKYEMRRLSVGDFLWVARHKDTKEELVLPYAVERKRMDDLAGSITDGRYHEQKYRLRQSGIPNIIYLVEEYKHTRLPLSTLMQATVNTTVQDGIMTHQTSSRVSSLKFLATMTTFICNTYQNKTLGKCLLDAESKFSEDNTTLQLPDFKSFNQESNKNKSMNVKNMFIKQLIQLKGISIEKALAISEAYQTPRLLLQKYQECDGQSHKEQILSKLKCINGGNVGPHISKILYQYYTSNVLH